MYSLRNFDTYREKIRAHITEKQLYPLFWNLRPKYLKIVVHGEHKKLLTSMHKYFWLVLDVNFQNNVWNFYSVIRAVVFARCISKFLSFSFTIFHDLHPVGFNIKGNLHFSWEPSCFWILWRMFWWNSGSCSHRINPNFSFAEIFIC